MQEWLDTLSKIMNYRVTSGPHYTSVPHITVEQIVMIGAVATALYITVKLLGKALRISKMRKRAKLSKEVCEIIEDHMVNAFNEAIASKRITIDEGRELYARFARLGFWGLHPRKFTPRKTGEELDALKETLRAKKAAREASKKQSTMSVVDKLLDGLDAELA